MKNKPDIKKVLIFLEDMRLLNQHKQGPKKLISIRIPENLIFALKNKAEFENKKYQNLIVQAIEEFLLKESKSNNKFYTDPV